MSDRLEEKCKMECIICKDIGSEPLQDNFSCACKYKRHNSCWIDYVHSTQTVKCLICRQSIKPVTSPKTHSALHRSTITSPLIQPSAPEPYALPSGTPISFNEVQQILENNTYQTSNTVVQPKQNKVSSKQKLSKTYKAICLLGIIIFVVVVTILFIAL